MAEPVSWAALTSLGILVALFSAFIQERKLSLDLFDRRFAAYEAVNDGVNDRMLEIASLEDFTLAPPDEARRALWKSMRIMRPLFPAAVTDLLQELEERLVELATARAKVLAGRGMNLPAPRIAPDLSAYVSAQRAVDKLQTALAEAVKPVLRQETALESLRRRWADFTRFR